MWYIESVVTLLKSTTPVCRHSARLRILFCHSIIVLRYWSWYCIKVIILIYSNNTAWLWPKKEKNLVCVVFYCRLPHLFCLCTLSVCVSVVLLCCRCVYGAAGAAGWHAVQGGREGVMANIRGKEPLTHGISNIGLWKIHLNTHRAWHTLTVSSKKCT